MGVEVLQILSIGLVFLGLLIFLCFFMDFGIGGSVIEALIVAVFGSLIICVLLFLSLATKESQLCRNHKGPCVISCYDNPLYAEELADWTKKNIQARTTHAHVATETIYMNPICNMEMSLFDPAV